MVRPARQRLVETIKDIYESLPLPHRPSVDWHGVVDEIIAAVRESLEEDD